MRQHAKNDVSGTSSSIEQRGPLLSSNPIRDAALPHTMNPEAEYIAKDIVPICDAAKDIITLPSEVGGIVRSRPKR